jgi:phage gp45-like
MRRLRLLRLLAACALLLLLMVPALALAKIKVTRGTYIEVKTQTYIVTNAAATKIKSLNVPCIHDGQQYGGNLITKALKINGGKFSFDGKSTLRGVGNNSVIGVKVTGTFGNGKITGKISYAAPVACTTRSYSAKYYGVDPQG